MSEDSITSFLHSRGATTVAAILLAALSLLAFGSDAIVSVEGHRGLILPSPNLWLPRGYMSLGVNLVLLIGAAAGMQALNKEYNIMRSLTSLWATLFLVNQCAVPSIDAQLTGGALLTVIFVMCAALLFGCYDRPARRRPVFLIFVILSGASLFQYGYMFFIPVFIAGMVQMKVFSFKSLVAAFLGMVTPQWILFGTGLLSIDDVAWPRFVSSLSVLSGREVIILMSAIGATAFIGIGFFIGNFMKLLSYNARNRAFNGFLALMLMATVLLLVIDYHNVALYWPLLNMLAAYQTAHFFTSRRFTRSYIPLLMIVVLDLTFYALAIY